MSDLPDPDIGGATRVRRLLVGIGLVLLIPGGTLLLLGLAGLVPTDFLAVGPSSGLRTAASVAVAGCLLAAVGYWDQ